MSPPALAGEIAEESYRQAIALAPNDPGGYNNLAWLFAERKTHLDEALQLAKQANELAPNRGELLDTLGWVYFQKKVYTYVGDHGG